MNIKEMRHLLQTRKISVPELTDAYIKAIQKKNPELNCFITITEETARKQAIEAQKQMDAGKSGSLLGIPISVKDNISTQGIRTTCASKMLAAYVPEYSATAFARCNGTVLLGKTNMDEFGMGSTSQNSYFGGVQNPYKSGYVPGGSSGGAAAAVASGLSMAALCSDTGGSVRQPAAFCGVTGLKPTYGLVSRYGLVAFASSLEQIGVIAGAAEDCGIVLSAIAGRDEKDMTTWQAPKINPLEELGKNIAGIRIGIPAEFYTDAVSDAVKKAVLQAAEFYRKQGCTIIETSMPALSYAVPAYYLISSAEAASNLSRFDGVRYGHRSELGNDFLENMQNTRNEGFGKEVKRRILLGNYALSGGYYDQYYQNAARIRTRIRQEFAAQFDECDVLLTPTAPTTAYPIASKTPVNTYMEDFCTAAVNLAGLPAISTPCGYDAEGLPIGMSLIGNAFSEARLIGLADAFERNFKRQEAKI